MKGRKSEASQSVIKGDEDKVFLWMQSCSNYTCVHFSGFLSMAILLHLSFPQLTDQLYCMELALSQLCSTSSSCDGWRIQTHNPLSCIWDMPQYAGQIRFLFWVPICISRYHKTWADFAQIWYPALPEEGYAKVLWTALQIENASASMPQKNLRSWLLIQLICRYSQPQQRKKKKSCEG